MNNYFYNPELRKSSTILIALMIVFIACTSLLLKLHHDNLKEDYINVFGSISAKVAEKDPEMAREMIPLITKGIGEEDMAKGKMFLKEYGISKSLENELFPYLESTVLKNTYTFTIMVFILTILLFVFNYFQYGIFYKKLRRITQGAKKVVEGEYDIAISEDREGDFSKLAFAFNSMRGIIRNNINELQKEKQFLVDLLSDISHQLKTPLASMIVYNDIMINKELTREQNKTFLLNNQGQLNRMDWLIKSILKLARIDAKAIEFNKENQSLNETIDEALEALERKALDAKVNINFKQDKEIEFKHDRLWLQEAVINIVKNAIEHTKGGGEINIDIEENPLYKRITIEDTGEGIPEEELPYIFKRFYKAKTSKKTESIGIGLALAKSIIESHKGIIEVESEIGKGTKFIITLMTGM